MRHFKEYQSNIRLNQCRNFFPPYSLRNLSCAFSVCEDTVTIRAVMSDVLRKSTYTCRHSLDNIAIAISQMCLECRSSNIWFARIMPSLLWSGINGHNRLASTFWSRVFFTKGKPIWSKISKRFNFGSLDDDEMHFVKRALLSQIENLEISLTTIGFFIFNRQFLAQP